MSCVIFSYGNPIDTSGDCTGDPLIARNSSERLHVSFSLVQDPEDINDDFSTFDGMAELIEPLKQRALAPWNTVMNFNRDRYPQYLPQAICNCKHCKKEFICETVYYNVPVLWKSKSCDHHNRFKYTTGWERLPVGCTCASPRVMNW